MFRLSEMQRTGFTVAQFLSFQTTDSLVLSPSFQRRPVWKPKQKSYLLDTIVRGFPIPIVFLRERLDVKKKKTTYEVVDGQQRLRTVLSFVDESCLDDFEPAQDRFLVLKSHNKSVAGKPFESLNEDIQGRILSYRISTHVLPASTHDALVLQLFARMNSTGVKTTNQELRNAEFLGEFKQLMYKLAYEQLDRWRDWGVFTEHDIARMKEVELVSDLALNFLRGTSGKTKSSIDALYKAHEDDFPEAKVIASRFRTLMDVLDAKFGKRMSTSAYNSEVMFFTLACFMYDRMFGLGSPMKKKKPGSVPASLVTKLIQVSKDIQVGRVPKKFEDAFGRASTDLGRRQTRLEFFQAQTK